MRTPFGKFDGALAGIRPDDLAAHIVCESLARVPGHERAQNDEVVFGNANGACEEHRNGARMAVLLAGLPVSAPIGTAARTGDSRGVRPRSRFDWC